MKKMMFTVMAVAALMFVMSIQVFASEQTDEPKPSIGTESNRAFGFGRPEVVYGICTNAHGDGMILADTLFPVDPKYNYISYSGISGAEEIHSGDIVKTTFIYYYEDVCDRLTDVVVGNVYDDIALAE